MGREGREIETSYSTSELLRAVSFIAVAQPTLVHVGILLLPGDRSPSLALFALAIVVAWVGAIWGRPGPALVGRVGVFLFGVWWVTIGLVMVPVSVILLVTAFFVLGDASERSDRLPGR